MIARKLWREGVFAAIGRKLRRDESVTGTPLEEASLNEMIGE